MEGSQMMKNERFRNHISIVAERMGKGFVVIWRFL